MNTAKKFAKPVLSPIQIREISLAATAKGTQQMMKYGPSAAAWAKYGLGKTLTSAPERMMASPGAMGSRVGAMLLNDRSKQREPETLTRPTA